MKRALTAVVLTLTMAVVANPQTALAGDGVEKLRYSWSVKGSLAWLARLILPGSGVGTLETTEGDGVRSRLTIRGDRQSGYAYYDSRMSSDGTRTFTSADGYSWLNRSEEQRVTFDYGKGVAHVEKRSDEGVERKTRKLNDATPQDVLTSIYYLRQNADSIRAPRRAEVYSGGKPYTFVFAPQKPTRLDVAGQSVLVRPFDITPENESKKGAVRVWLTEDAARVPVRIEIEQNRATLRLDLDGF